jgi:molybdopterin biosynthesis enzyme
MPLTARSWPGAALELRVARHGAGRQGLARQRASRPVREDHDRRHHAARPGHRGAAGILRSTGRSAGFISIPPGLLRAGDNRRLRGEDLMQGRPALRKGERLTPARLGLAASLGLPTLRVLAAAARGLLFHRRRDPELGEAPREGAVYDSNRYTVFGMLSRLGCEVIDMGVVRDDPALLEAAFTARRRAADAIITRAASASARPTSPRP